MAGHLRITAFSTAMRGLVAPLVRDLRVGPPGPALSLTEREPWDTIELVASGQADVGVAHSWGDVPLAIPDHLATTSLAEDVADVVVHASHRLATRARVRPHDLVDEGWIATPDGTICREWLLRMYQGTGRQPLIAHESMEFQSHLALVRAGLGIALVPRLGREELSDDLVALRAHDPVPTRNIVAVHRRSMADVAGGAGRGGGPGPLAPVSRHTWWASSGKRQDDEPLRSSQSSLRVDTTRARTWSHPGQRSTVPGPLR